ncbi:heat shock cognate 70 [Coccidioides immitis H538.4]|uniref:Heat shock cognate 70 n=1 Tax=Coccidioides immitis H538.4 TaxID=396776 RepID=A0A0J8S3B5_COCIT|nr:heat shock cognate 70 [Coccidioides immitis H538.4]
MGETADSHLGGIINNAAVRHSMYFRNAAEGSQLLLQILASYATSLPALQISKAIYRLLYMQYIFQLEILIIQLTRSASQQLIQEKDYLNVQDDPAIKTEAETAITAAINKEFQGNIEIDSTDEDVDADFERTPIMLLKLDDDGDNKDSVKNTDAAVQLDGPPGVFGDMLQQLHRKLDWPTENFFEYVILDEEHKVKNSRTSVHKAIALIPRDYI